MSLPLLVSMSTKGVPEAQRGLALELRGAANQTAGTAAPVVVGSLMSAMGLIAGLTSGGLAAGGILVGAYAVHRRGVHADGRAVPTTRSTAPPSRCSGTSV